MFQKNYETDEMQIKAVDNLLSKELLQLSMEDRNALEEEIHGVRCNATEETPELLQAALQKLLVVLESDQIIPRHEKRSYLQSKLLPRSYIHTDGFRLRFLRATLFDVVRAARKMVRFLDVASRIFGNQLLERPPRMSDFNKRELQYMRNGNIQLLPFRDRSGRRVVALMNPIAYNQEEHDKFVALGSNVNKRRQSKHFMFSKMFLYLNWVAGEDVDTQRKGLVWVCWFDPSFNVVVPKDLRSHSALNISAEDITAVRVAALHVCVPDTTLHRLATAMIRLRVAFHSRLKMKAHYGESVELMYQLQSFGIPTEHIPISFSGTIKTGYLKQWCRSREAQESSMYLALGNDFRDIIECPQLSDVLFRQGISLIWNPGNARVRTLIEKMIREQEITDTGKAAVKPKRREMVLDIIEEISRTSRFLVWNEGGWWNQISDREHLILKIEYLIKEVRKARRVERRHSLKLNSSTSIFRSERHKNDHNRLRSNSFGGGNTDTSSDDDQFTCGKECFKIT